MFSLLKSAIKKDASTKGNGNGDLDDFFSKGAGADAQNDSLTPGMANTAPGEGNGKIKAIRNEFRASEYGLVIRDLDQEKNETPNDQSIAADDDTTQIGTTGAFEASGTAADGSMEELPDSGQNIGEAINADEALPRSLDYEGLEGTEVGSQFESKDAPDQESSNNAVDTAPRDLGEETAEEAEYPSTAGWDAGNHVEEAAANVAQAELTGEDDGQSHTALSHEVPEYPADGQVSNGNAIEAENIVQQAREDEQVGLEDAGSMAIDINDASQAGDRAEDAAWEPRNLDEELGPPANDDGSQGDERSDLQESDGIQIEDLNIENRAGNEAPDYEGEAYEFNANQSEEDYETSGNENEDGTNLHDNTSMVDEAPLEQKGDFNADDGYPGDARSEAEGEALEGMNDENGDDIRSEMADSLQQEEDIPEDANSDDESTGERFGDGLDQGEDVEPSDEQLEQSDAEFREEELSDLDSNVGNQVDLDESVTENPLAVPLKKWTKAHMAAFRVHVRPKANLFDFLVRKGVQGRERVSEVVGTALKLCLENSTAVRGKTHARVYMEAGSTPLGPFFAFLALTLQSTMNSTNNEKDTKDKRKDEKVRHEDNEGGEGAETEYEETNDGETKDEDANDEDAIAEDAEDEDAEDEEAKEGKNRDEDAESQSTVEEADPWDDLDLMDDLEEPPSLYEPPKPKAVESKPAHDSDDQSKRTKVATNILVVMFLQAVLESSRAAISEPANAYLEWTFIPQTLQINSGPTNLEDENDGSLHEKRSKRTAAQNLKWEDVNPLEYVSIGVSQSSMTSQSTSH
jgi:hypothetical protein